jgi:hypothetical protein
MTTNRMLHSSPTGRLIAVIAALFLSALMLASGAAQAAEPVKISRDDTALDLTATTEIYANQGEAFQVSTAAGADGIRRRIEVRSSSATTRATGRCLRLPTSPTSSWSASSSHRISVW